MNERIVKLFMQSVDSNYIPLPVEDHIPSWTEKFAELIVAEMLQTCEDHPAWTGRMIGEEIKQHFGVQ